MSPMDEKAIWRILERVMDPEIPVISLVDLGVIREVSVDDQNVQVAMTPTFAGCPALHMMRQQVEEAILQAGANSVEIELRLAPPWTTDDISQKGRLKLKQFGLAPPPLHGGRSELIFFDLACCPRCDGQNTSLKNAFGSTQCRAIYYCIDCQEPFEQFKPL